MTRYHSQQSRRIRAARRKQADSVFSFKYGFDTSEATSGDLAILPRCRNHNKKKPGDCGISRCRICHYDKYHGKGYLKMADLAAEVSRREQLDQMLDT